MVTCFGPSAITRRLVPKTINPVRASASAVALPMPDEAPVTIATFPDCFFIVSSNRTGQIAGRSSGGLFMMIIMNSIYDSDHV
jgi:hypothetical protein